MPCVNMLYGRCGRLFDALIEDIRAARIGGAESIVLVPEQYTLQAERDIIAGLEVEGLIDVTVLSPTRMTRYISQRAGHRQRTVLNGRGMRMAMGLSLTAVQKKLQYYQSVSDKTGFTEKMVTLIQGLKNGGLTLDKYEQLDLTDMKLSTRLKHQDIQAVWRGYDKVMEGRFIDSEDEQADMIRRLEKNALMKGITLFVYGFDMLSEMTMQLITAAAKDALQVTVYMMMDELNAPDGDVYHPMRYSLTRLSALLKLNGIASNWQAISPKPLAAAPAIRHLEANLFALKPALYELSPDGIYLTACLTPYQEAMRMAAQIVELNEKGIPYGNIAVLLCNEETYQSLLPSVFKSYDIPFYLARKAPAATHGLIRFMLSALQTISEGYVQGILFAHMKSGFTLLTEDECFQIENYAIENGITRNKWLKPFTRGKNAAEMEPLRQRLMAPLVKLREGIMAAKKAEESMTAIFTLLTDVAAYETLLNNEQMLLALDMQAEAAQNRQVWQQVLSLLDQMAELLSGKRAPGIHVAAWLEAGLSEAELSALPPTADEVTVGKVGHVMTGQIQAAFILGLQDDVLIRASDKLLTDEEIAPMKQALELSLIPQTEDMNCLAKCDLIKAVALPRNRLYISFAEATTSGEPLRPNALIDWLTRRVFSKLSVLGSVLDKPYDQEPMAPLAALETLAQRMAENDLNEQWLHAYRYFIKTEGYREQMMMALDALAGTRQTGKLPKDKAWPLFMGDTVSVSRLEKYARCPYRHFVDHGLVPQELNEYAFSYADKGNFHHNALMRYMVLAGKRKDWLSFGREENDKLVDEAIAEEIAAWEEGPLSESKRARQQANGYIGIAKRAAWLLLKHAQNGRFETVGTEVQFGFDGALPPLTLNLADGSQVALRGKIDRVDQFNENGESFVRIVDYKSSEHSLDPAKMLGGWQLQLLIYFQALLNAQKNVSPAGAFYFHIQDPLVETNLMDPDALDELIANDCHLNGLALDLPNVIDAMRSDSKGYSSIKNVFKQDGSFVKDAPVLSKAEWDALLKRVNAIASDLALHIRSGEIDAMPSRCGKETSCDFCQYNGICLVDLSREDVKMRVLPKVTQEAFREKLSADE